MQGFFNGLAGFFGWLAGASDRLSAAVGEIGEIAKRGYVILVRVVEDREAFKKDDE